MPRMHESHREALGGVAGGLDVCLTDCLILIALACVLLYTVLANEEERHFSGLVIPPGA